MAASRGAVGRGDGIEAAPALVLDADARAGKSGRIASAATSASASRNAAKLA